MKSDVVIDVPVLMKKWVSLLYQAGVVEVESQWVSYALNTEKRTDKAARDAEAEAVGILTANQIQVI